MLQDPRNSTSETEGKTLAHKRFRITFDIEARYIDIPFHPDDEVYARVLQDSLLTNEELMRKLMLSRCADRLELDLSKWLAKSELWDSTARDVVESVARSAPIEVVREMMLGRLDGIMSFEDELTGSPAQCNITSMKILDVDQDIEILPGPPLERLFQIDEYQKIVLAKTTTNWIAGMRVRLNREKEEARIAALKTALEWIDQIQAKILDNDLPLTEVSIGIIAADQLEYEEAKEKITNYSKDRLPGTEIRVWFRQEKRLREMTMEQLIHFAKSHGEEQNP